MKAMQHDPAGRQVFKVNFDQQNTPIVASCRDYERYIGVCEHRANGWLVVVPVGSDMERQVRRSNRSFQEQRIDRHELAPNMSLIAFTFGAGQECFGHRLPTQDPRLMHFDQAHEDLENRDDKGRLLTSTITPIMRRNAKPWRPVDFMEKFHEELMKREELLRAEGLL